jgi:hypothetical protein
MGSHGLRSGTRRSGLEQRLATRVVGEHLQLLDWIVMP